MENNNYVDTTFLFGAGVECQNPFLMPTGINFFSQSLFGDDALSLTAALKSFFKDKQFNRWKYSAHCFSGTTKNLFRQILINNLNQSKYLSEYTANTAKTILKDKMLFSDYAKNWKIYLLACYGHKEFDPVEEKYQSFFDELMNKNSSFGFGNIIDDSFSSFINPDVYGKVNFSRLFNFYWASFFAILKPILLLFSKVKEELSDYIEDDKVLYKEVLENLDDVLKCIYSVPIDFQDTYYSEIERKFDKQVNVVTTNYFQFCKQATCHEPAYLNGQLNLFEIPETLEVKNYDKDVFSNKVFVPFLFGQSKTKPIVHPIQLENYHRFYRMLQKSKNIAVIGYGLNEDDNHINAYLRDALKSSYKKIVFVGEQTEKELLARLHISSSDCGLRVIDYKNRNPKSIIEEIHQIFN